MGAEPEFCSPDALRPQKGLLCTALFSSPPSSPEALHIQRRERPLLAREGSMGEEMAYSILRTACDFHGKCTDLSHAAKLQHGTDGFTSPPKEGMLRIFVARKIRRLQPGLNPRTSVPEASMLTTRPLKPLRCGLESQTNFFPFKKSPKNWVRIRFENIWYMVLATER
jgi:hypothetical protein